MQVPRTKYHSHMMSATWHSVQEGRKQHMTLSRHRTTSKHKYIREGPMSPDILVSPERHLYSPHRARTRAHQVPFPIGTSLALQHSATITRHLLALQRPSIRVQQVFHCSPLPLSLSHFVNTLAHHVCQRRRHPRAHRDQLGHMERPASCAHAPALCLECHH
jgi:hypothetical protein